VGSGWFQRILGEQQFNDRRKIEQSGVNLMASIKNAGQNLLDIIIRLKISD
jgi:hypothetical protein